MAKTTQCSDATEIYIGKPCLKCGGKLRYRNNNCAACFRERYAGERISGPRRSPVDLKFADYKHLIPDDVIDEAYGEFGRMFPTEEEAQAWARASGRKYWITPVRNYRESDIITVEGFGLKRVGRGVPREGAVPYIKGYQVTLAGAA